MLDFGVWSLRTISIIKKWIKLDSALGRKLSLKFINFGIISESKITEKANVNVHRLIPGYTYVFIPCHAELVDLLCTYLTSRCVPGGSESMSTALQDKFKMCYGSIPCALCPTLKRREQNA